MAKHNQSARLGNLSDFSERPTQPPKREFPDSDIEARVANLERAVNEILLQLADLSEQLDQPRTDQVSDPPPKQAPKPHKEQSQPKQQPQPKPQEKPKPVSTRWLEPEPLSEEQVATLSDRIYELLLDGTTRTKAEICKAIDCSKSEYAQARQHLINTERMQDGDGNDLVAGKIGNAPEGLAILTQEQVNVELQSKTQDKSQSAPTPKAQPNSLSEEQVATLSDRIYELLLDGTPRSKAEICKAIDCSKSEYAQARQHLIATQRMQGGGGNDLVAGKIGNALGVGLVIWTQEQIDAELQKGKPAKTPASDDNT